MRSNESLHKPITVGELLALLRSIPQEYKVIINAPTFDVQNPEEVVSYDETPLTDVISYGTDREVYLYGEV